MKTEREKIPVTIELYKDQAAKFFALCYYLKSGMSKSVEEPLEEADPEIDMSPLKGLLEGIEFAGCSPDKTLKFLMNCIHIPRMDDLHATMPDESNTEEDLLQTGHPEYDKVKQFITGMTELKNRLLELDATQPEEHTILHRLILSVIREIREGKVSIRKRDNFWYAASQISPDELPVPSELYLESFFTHNFGVRLEPYEFIDKFKHTDKKYIINKVYKSLMTNKILPEFRYQTRILTGFVCSHVLEGFCPFNQNEGKYKKSEAAWKKELEKAVARLLKPE